MSQPDRRRETARPDRPTATPHGHDQATSTDATWSAGSIAQHLIDARLRDLGCRDVTAHQPAGHPCQYVMGFRPSKCVTVVTPIFTDEQAGRVLGTNGWPYGPNICQGSRDALVAWALANDLRLSECSASPLDAFAWLVGRKPRRPVKVWWSDTSLYNDPLDHVTLWIRNGRAALILAQPYGPPSADWIAATEETWPVNVRVTAAAPWYGYGACGVFITRAEPTS